jgi:hypothetical protein
MAAKLPESRNSAFGRLLFTSGGLRWTFFALATTIIYQSE